MIDLDAGARLLVALYDGWFSAPGALQGDGLVLGAITLPGKDQDKKKEVSKVSSTLN